MEDRLTETRESERVKTMTLNRSLQVYRKARFISSFLFLAVAVCLVSDGAKGSVGG
ncbi:hypothetical protein BaRGS_00035046, partial [Batillaria attramentaria]